MPVVDRIAADFGDEVAFVAVAGRSTMDKTAARAGELFSNRIAWGLDEAIWDLYGVFGQPYTVLITGGDLVVDAWFGIRPEGEIRAALEALVQVGA